MLLDKMHSVLFHTGNFVRGGGSRMEGRTNFTLKFELIKNYHKVTELTTRTTKEHAPDQKCMFISECCLKEV